MDKVKSFDSRDVYLKFDLDATPYEKEKDRLLREGRPDALGRTIRVNNLVTFAKYNGHLFFGIVTDIKPSMMIVKNVRNGEIVRLTNPEQSLIIDNKTQAEILMLKLTKDYDE